MSPNFCHYSHSLHFQTQLDPLDSEDPSSTSRKVDGVQILLKKIQRKIALIVGCRINSAACLGTVWVDSIADSGMVPGAQRRGLKEDNVVAGSGTVPWA
jgi:hypothetical protein